MKTIDVNGKRFRSLSQAARYIRISTSRLSELLKNKKEFMFDNFRIQEIPKPKKPKPKSKYCKVLQINTGKIFNTISEASRYAGVDSWTMSVKMETAGSFIDKNGNEYKRLSPMITKNKYVNTGKTIKLNHVQRFFPTFDELVPVNHKIPVETVKEKKDNVQQIVKDAINEKIILMLKEKGLYEDVVNLLNYGGFSTIKIID